MLILSQVLWWGSPVLSSVSFSSLARWVSAGQLQLPYRRAWKDSTRTPKVRKQRVSEGLEDGEKMVGSRGVQRVRGDAQPWRVLPGRQL